MAITATFGDLSWNTSFTYSANRNKIIKLLDDENEVLKQGGLSGAEIILKKGGTMGDVYMTTDFARDAEGTLLLTTRRVFFKPTLTTHCIVVRYFLRLTSVSRTSLHGKDLTSVS